MKRKNVGVQPSGCEHRPELQQGLPRRKLLKTCLLVALPLAVVISLAVRPQLDPDDVPASTSPDPSFDPSHLEAVLAARAALDRTLWAPEQTALAHESPFILLWDKLRAQRDAAGVLDGFTFTSLRIGTTSKADLKQNQIERYLINQSPRTIGPKDFRRLVSRWQAAGYRLKQSEWHHERFQPLDDGRHRSIIHMTLHVESAEKNERIEITGPLIVSWSGQWDGPYPVPENIDATGLVLTTRRGRKAFVEQFVRPLETIQTEATYNDVLACDLNGDGLSEIAYPRSNLLLWNRGDGTFESGTLCDRPRQGICEGLLVDFTGDGRPDFLCAAVNDEGNSRAIFLYTAGFDGTFSEPPQQLTPGELDLPSPDTITVGDIDTDGDLDLFVTQYHAPYREGKMPSPYYDANDGLPCYLFLNEGQQKLRDVTLQRGIRVKRQRRAYRSSLVDLDDDADLDLLVVSDFSGVDIYENDGRGYFRDVTDPWIDKRTLFGMSHVVADFNNDSSLDLYVTGMASTTARRLESLGLARPGFPEDRRWRSQLAYGNRLYFGSAGPRYTLGPGSDDVARAGWSWGCAALDVENDGDVDLYVANGHLSGESATDYCTRFWCHDIYAEHQNTPGFQDLFQRNSLRIGNDVSWNGYEKNRLFLNQRGRGFLSAAFLMDVAIEADSRSVLADDFDGDGRMDLLVGWSDRTTRPPRYVLQGLRNQWDAKNHWIGVRPLHVPGALLIGAKIFVETDTGTKTDTIITGESFAAQQAAVFHFGLGETSSVQAIEVRWTGGTTTRLEQPAVDQYHTLQPFVETGGSPVWHTDN